MKHIKRYAPLLGFLAVVTVLAGSLVIYAVFYYDEDADTGLGDESDIVRVPVDVPTSTPPGDCTFTPSGSEIALYHAPLADPAQQRDTAAGDAAYPVLMARSGFVFINVEADRSGWVLEDDGTLDGACDSLPTDEKAWSDYQTLCTFESFTEIALFTGPDLTESAGSLPPAEYPVTRRTDSAVAVYREDTHVIAWVDAEYVRLHGACDQLASE